MTENLGRFGHHPDPAIDFCVEVDAIGMICNYPNCDGGYATGYCHNNCRDAPQQWFTCDACDGAGEIPFGYWGFEPGCGHGHMIEDANPCGKCGGLGGWIDDVEADYEAA